MAEYEKNSFTEPEPQSSPNVHLDWTLDGTSGPFVLKRSLSFIMEQSLQRLGEAPDLVRSMTRFDWITALC